ncbi:uncharacterized protein LOC114353259 [Ostrinia furnacalis]|uniref:uncharacterized protein LOC114353259 n=1 Tax=Ostrinia furnacalis TaxID=93504 RepID=UPI00103F4E7B|nr:uncharacterized protein LOC114353259 [Ostrinia furnacalis]
MMEQSTSANTSRVDLDSSENSQAETEMESVTSKEICTDTIDIVSDNVTISATPESPGTFDLGSTLSENLVTTAVNTSIPLVIVSRPPSLVIQSRKSLQPFINSDLPSPASVIAGQPQSLFLQALSKLNESSLSMAVMNHFKTTQPNTSGQTMGQTYWRKSAEISPPDSLASAPPSYSFVLRQMAVRRRPRIVGTFIPSPSFVQHTPPPNYAAAFDIYVDNPIPPPPTRVYNFGFTSMPVVCPDCGYTGMTVVTSKITICTHLCAVILCIMCCWVCAPLPYVLRSCKDVYHYCRNCRNFLGMYCPTNPEQSMSPP